MEQPADVPTKQDTFSVDDSTAMAVAKAKGWPVLYVALPLGPELGQCIVPWGAFKMLLDSEKVLSRLAAEHAELRAVYAETTALLRRIVGGG